MKEVHRVVLPLILLLSGTLFAQEAAWETREIADGVYQFRHGAYHTLFVVQPEGVVAFDPISSEVASIYADEIVRVAPDTPLRAIVYSHRHADHATGGRVLRERFGDGIPVIAHENAAPKIEEANDLDLPPPDLTFSERLILRSSSRPVELHFLGKSHSDNLIVGYLPNEKILFAVDLVANDAVGWRDLGSHHFPEFFTTIQRLQELDYETVLFGHDPPGDRATVERQIRYYSALRNAVAQGIENGWTVEEILKNFRFPGYRSWKRFEEHFPMNVRGVYRWIVGEEGPEGE